MTREEVVQAAIKVERWCAEHDGYPCDCPFFEQREFDGAYKCRLTNWRLLHSDIDEQEPEMWNLAEFLRKRGLKDGSV